LKHLLQVSAIFLVGPRVEVHRNLKSTAQTSITQHDSYKFGQSWRLAWPVDGLAHLETKCPQQLRLVAHALSGFQATFVAAFKRARWPSVQSRRSLTAKTRCSLNMPKIFDKPQVVRNRLVKIRVDALKRGMLHAMFLSSPIS
jgi:hypothetical protein